MIMIIINRHFIESANYVDLRNNVFPAIRYWIKYVLILNNPTETMVLLIRYLLLINNGFIPNNFQVNAKTMMLQIGTH